MSARFPRALPALFLLLLGCGASGDAEIDADAVPPSPRERLDAWAALPPGTAVPVAIGFGRVLPDSTVASLLQRNGLRPYAVYVRAAGLDGSAVRDRSRASLEVLGEAREQALTQVRESLCAQQGRARAMLNQPGEGLTRERELLAHFLQLLNTLPALELGEPLIYGVEAVGMLSEVRAVESDPTVASYEPGWPVPWGEVPPPPAPDGAVPELPREVATLGADEVAERMDELAENGMGACEEAARPDNPPPP